MDITEGRIGGISLRVGQGQRPGIGSHLPGEKTAEDIVEDEDDSQGPAYLPVGQGRPLPCPLFPEIIFLEIKRETCYDPEKMGRWQTWQ